MPFAHNSRADFEPKPGVSIASAAAARSGLPTMLPSTNLGCSSQIYTPKLATSLPTLDAFFDGGLPFGSLIEWGVPLGQGGREVVTRFLAAATQQTEPRLWCVWMYAHRDLRVYPPAWYARGIDLQRLRFVHTTTPLIDLKPLFIDPFFQCMVVDAPPQLKRDDCAFMARQARKHHKIIFLLRNYFLSTAQGNIWAKLRLNCWQDPNTSTLNLQMLRGLSPRQHTIALSEWLPT